MLDFLGFFAQNFRNFELDGENQLSYPQNLVELGSNDECHFM